MTGQQSDYKKKTLLLIVIATIARLLLSGLSELNNDEVYYWTYAKHLQWNYFDHPPMVAACIRFFTAGLRLDHEIFIRLTSVVCSALGTWIMFCIGKRISDARTGWLAACLFTASFYSSIIAGILILPDSPQLLFWLLSVWIMIVIVKQNSSVSIWLLLLGVTIGLSILSKVHGLFLWAGFAGYCLFHKRALLRNPFLYAGILITILLLIPAALWSLENQLAGYDYHSNRISARRFRPDSFFRELAGSFAYNNPVNVILLVTALVYFFKKRKTGIIPSLMLICWTGLPLIITVLAIALFNNTLPHWSGPGYTTLILVSALYLRSRPAATVRRIVRTAIGMTASAVVLAMGIINYWPGTLGKKTMPRYGKNDATLDMTGWRAFGKDFQTFYQKDIAARKDTPRTIFSNYWFPAAHFDYYVAKPSGLHVQAFGSPNEIHHFTWLNKLQPPLKQGESAYYISVSNFYKPVPEELAEKFEHVSDSIAIPQFRNGDTARLFYIFRLEGYKKRM